MTMTRRSLLLAGSALAVAPSFEALAQAAAGPLTAGEVIRRIKETVGIPWMVETVDKIVAGGPEVRVKGVAVTMMATLDVLQRAAAAGKNMVITHEPTFWSHQDGTADLKEDPTFKFKDEFIKARELVVFRFHDHWHRMKPDGIDFGMTRELGWEKNVDAGNAWQFTFPETTLGKFADGMAAKLGAKSMRVVGDPKMPVRRVAANWGYGSLMPGLRPIAATAGIDVVIVGETREWELVEYVQDQISSGEKKALIVVGHVLSEQAGMKYCAEWLKPLMPEVGVEFVAAKEPFWVARG